MGGRSMDGMQFLEYAQRAGGDFEGWHFDATGSPAPMSAILAMYR